MCVKHLRRAKNLPKLIGKENVPCTQNTKCQARVNTHYFHTKMVKVIPFFRSYAQKPYPRAAHNYMANEYPWLHAN